MEIGPVVETTTGKVQGTYMAGVKAFLGIPFGAPPTGELRFKPPAPVIPWPGIRDASEFQSADAPQQASPMSSLYIPPGRSVSEDCLYLNIWTPEADAYRRSVMVYIHGGGFIAGGSSYDIFNGAMLAARGDVVIVTFNYRLGALGLLAHPSLRDERTAVDGNWAFLDQIAALRWVQENVARFGGDPENVTIFGQSAGGVSVFCHCISPESRKYFKRAIVQSGSPRVMTRKAHYEAAEIFFKSLGIDPANPASIRQVELRRILEAQKPWVQALLASEPTAAGIRVMVDGVAVPHWPVNSFKTGIADGVDLWINTNRDEWQGFAVVDPEAGLLDEVGLRKRIAALLPNDFDRIIETFRNARTRRGESADPWDLWVAFKTESYARVPAMDFLARHKARGNRAFASICTWESPWKHPALHGRTLGACHLIDMPFVWGTLNTAWNMNQFAGQGSEADTFMEICMDAWINFARTGSPETPALEPWPEYKAERRATMILGKKSGAQDAPWEPERQLMEEFYSI